MPDLNDIDLNKLLNIFRRVLWHSIEVVPMCFWLFFINFLLLNWLLFLLRIGFFCVALNSGRHPYPMGSFCKVLLFDWLRVGLLNLGLIKLLFISMLTFRVGLISGLLLYWNCPNPQLYDIRLFDLIKLVTMYISLCVWFFFFVKNLVSYQESQAL